MNDDLIAQAGSSPRAMEQLIRLVEKANDWASLLKVRREYPRDSGVTIALLESLHRNTLGVSGRVLVQCLETMGDDSAFYPLLGLLDGPLQVPASLALSRIDPQRATSPLNDLLLEVLNYDLEDPRLEPLMEAVARLENLDATMCLVRVALVSDSFREAAAAHLAEQRKLLVKALEWRQHQQWVLRTYIEFPGLTDPEAVAPMLQAREAHIRRLAARALAAAEWSRA